MTITTTTTTNNNNNDIQFNKGFPCMIRYFLVY